MRATRRPISMVCWNTNSVCSPRWACPTLTHYIDDSPILRKNRRDRSPTSTTLRFSLRAVFSAMADVDPGKKEALSGVINLNKPSGITSRQAVDVVKRLVRPAKTGHAGTLDPLASGVLIVCVGAATRLIEYVQRMPKRYTGTFLLGRSSPTEDIEGEVSELAGAPQPSLGEIIAAAGRLTGEIMQRPPAYSALKVAGRRAYDLARAGHEVDLQPRPI